MKDEIGHMSGKTLKYKSFKRQKVLITGQHANKRIKRSHKHKKWKKKREHNAI